MTIYTKFLIPSLARFQQIHIEQLHIPTITVFELYYGIEKNNSQQRN
jgi:tRNA(fMet)-specific endonuclease VapC